MNLFSRFILAMKTFFHIMSQGSLPSHEVSVKEADSEVRSIPPETDYRPAIQLIGALQRDGRLVDFVMEDLEGASDADIGVAARVIHQGCRKVLTSLFALEPVWPAPEGSPVTVEPGYDAEFVEPIGFAGQPPYHGTLNHKGWKIVKTNFPTLTDSFSSQLIQRAEIEK